MAPPMVLPPSWDPFNADPSMQQLAKKIPLILRLLQVNLAIQDTIQGMIRVREMMLKAAGPMCILADIGFLHTRIWRSELMMKMPTGTSPRDLTIRERAGMTLQARTRGTRQENTSTRGQRANVHRFDGGIKQPVRSSSMARSKQGASGGKT